MVRAQPEAGRSLRSRLGADGRLELGRRASWSSIIEVLQLASSMLVFFALTQLLSPADFGIMGGILAVALPAASLSSIGSHSLLIKRVAQGEDIQQAWQRALSMGVLGPALGALVIIGLKPQILPAVDTGTYILLVVSQLNFFWITELAVFVGNGTGRLREAARIRFVVVALRLGALGLFALLGGGDLIWWAWASFASFGLGAVAAVLYVWRVFGPRPSLRRASLADAREGVPFAVNSVSESLVDVSDRPLLVRYGHDVDAAIYTVAGRIIQFGYLPLAILMRASDVELFGAGKRGTRAALAVTRRLLPAGVGLAALVGVGFLILAPLIPVVAGEAYRDSVPAIRILAVLPLIRSVQYLMGNCLSASGHQWWRVGATISAAVVNFVLNVRFLPGGTWRTATYTTIVSEVFLVVVLVAVVAFRSWSEGRRPRESPLR